jgi:hypothetical protein
LLEDATGDCSISVNFVAAAMSSLVEVGGAEVVVTTGFASLPSIGSLTSFGALGSAVRASYRFLPVILSFDITLAGEAAIGLFAFGSTTGATSPFFLLGSGVAGAVAELIFRPAFTGVFTGVSGFVIVDVVISFLLLF